MKKIAIAMSKGGVGKTSTAVNLSYRLAEKGKKILLIDMDVQSHAAAILGMNQDTGLTALLEGTRDAMIVSQKARDNLFLIAGGDRLAGAARMLSKAEYGGEAALKNALAGIEGAYDCVIIDTAPGWDTLTINALFYADEILAPVSTESLAIRGLADLAKRVNNIRRFRPELEIKYILPTFLDMRTASSPQILKQLERRYGDKILPPIRYDRKLSDSAGHGKPIFEYAPKSRGALDYADVADKILKEMT